MYGLNNLSGVPIMPALANKLTENPQWFTEGGNGVEPSWPGQDWFNMQQAEALNVLAMAGLSPSPTQTDQLANAIAIIARKNRHSVLKRLAAEAGYNLVDGSFEDGATTVNDNDVVWYQENDHYYGGVIGQIIAGAIPAGDWSDLFITTLRADIDAGKKSIISYIHPEMYGARSDATGASGEGTDSTLAFIQAAAACLLTGKVLQATGQYRITGDIDLRYIGLDMTHAKILIDSSTSIIKLGGNSSSGNNPLQFFGSASRIAGANSVPEIRLSGVKDQNVHVECCEYALVWASTSPTVRDQEYSCSYSNFYFKRCIKLEINTDPLNANGPLTSDVGGSIQWVNECNFYLNRTTILLVDGSYNHNHNRFYCGTFEGESFITFNKGRDNRMFGERFEGGDAVVTFAVGTERNVIINSFDDSEFNGGPEIATVSIIDNGSQNIVADDFRLYYKTETVASADIADVVLSSEIGEITARQPYLQCIQGSSGSPLMTSEYLRARAQDYFFWNTHASDYGDVVLYRPFVTFFDKNLNKLTPNAAWLSSPTITSISGNDLQTGIGVSEARARVTTQAVSEGVMFIKVGWKASNGQLANGLARKLTIISATKENYSTTPLSVNKTQINKVVSAIPTKGFAPLGYSVFNASLTARYLNKFSMSTILTASSVANIITLSSVVGVLIGDVVGVNLADRTTHWTTVNAVSGNDVTLSSGVASPSYVGARVVFNRWTTETIA